MKINKDILEERKKSEPNINARSRLNAVSSLTNQDQKNTSSTRSRSQILNEEQNNPIQNFDIPLQTITTQEKRSTNSDKTQTQSRELSKSTVDDNSINQDRTDKFEEPTIPKTNQAASTTLLKKSTDLDKKFVSDDSIDSTII